MASPTRATLDAIAAELGRDREVKRLADGSIEPVDDMGFALAFQLTVRRPFETAGEIVNAPGAARPRGPNRVGVRIRHAEIRPRTLSHVVYFVPDAAKAEAFYVERLGFRCTDRFTGVGPFLRPAGTLDHHTLFLIQTPPFMKGCEHFTFHLGGPTEVLQAGYALRREGLPDASGARAGTSSGRNWFWYFNSPLGCHVEYRRRHGPARRHLGRARSADAGADASQIFLFQHREKWAPGGPPPSGQAH